MATTKHTRALARQLFKLSFEGGQLSAGRVQTILAVLEQNPPANYLTVLTSYHRLVQREQARGLALVEHAGPVDTSTLDAVSAALSQKYGRPITWRSKPAPALLAGLRVRVGDDVYESSVSGQLAALSAAV